MSDQDRSPLPPATLPGSSDDADSAVSGDRKRPASSLPPVERAVVGWPYPDRGGGGTRRDGAGAARYRSEARARSRHQGVAPPQERNASPHARTLRRGSPGHG